MRNFIMNTPCITSQRITVLGTCGNMVGYIGDRPIIDAYFWFKEIDTHIRLGLVMQGPGDVMRAASHLGLNTQVGQMWESVDRAIDKARAVYNAVSGAITKDWVAKLVDITNRFNYTQKGIELARTAELGRSDEVSNQAITLMLNQVKHGEEVYMADIFELHAQYDEVHHAAIIRILETEDSLQFIKRLNREKSK